MVGEGREGDKNGENANRETEEKDVTRPAAKTPKVALVAGPDWGPEGGRGSQQIPTQTQHSAEAIKTRDQRLSPVPEANTANTGHRPAGG